MGKQEKLLIIGTLETQALLEKKETQRTRKLHCVNFFQQNQLLIKKGTLFEDNQNYLNNFILPPEKIHKDEYNYFVFPLLFHIAKINLSYSSSQTQPKTICFFYYYSIRLHHFIHNIIAFRMHQVIDYVEKIKVLTQTIQNMPFEVQNFYIVLKSSVSEIKEKDISLELVNHFANVYKFLRTNLVEHPDLNKSNDMMRTDLKKLLQPLKKYLLQNDPFVAILLKNFDEAEPYIKLREAKQKAQRIIEELSKQKNVIHISGNLQVCITFWINEFKTDYAVHFSIFWEAILRFTNILPFYKTFINQSTRRAIKEIVDPEKKFYVGMAAANDLFHALNEPTLLKRLQQMTSLGLSDPQFQSNNVIKMRFLKNAEIISKLSHNDILLINGKSVFINGQQIECKYPQTIRFGSSNDSEVQIKHNYISRRQFMLIEEEFEFSIVCLSLSNYTSILYPQPFQLKSGTLFKVGKDTIQVLKVTNGLQNVQLNVSEAFSLTEYDQTLDYLPQNQSMTGFKELEYKILTGDRKDEKGVITSFENIIEIGLCSVTIICDTNGFYVGKDVQVIIKNSNQVLSGHLSDKVTLQRGMTIKLEQCSLTVQ